MANCGCSTRRGLPGNPYTALRTFMRWTGANRLFAPRWARWGRDIILCSAPAYLCSRGGLSHYRAMGETTLARKPPICRVKGSALGRLEPATF
jgi:hypothetical protein